VLHLALFLGVVHEIHFTCTIPTAAEKYNFKELEIHGKNFISETLKLCKVNQVQDVNRENVTKIGTKDIVENHHVHALQLIERQQMFIANERVHYQKDLKRLEEVIKELKDQLDNFTGKLTVIVKIANNFIVFIPTPRFISHNLGVMFAFPHISIVVLYIN
jgi:hypothetical protein